MHTGGAEGCIDCGIELSVVAGWREYIGEVELRNEPEVHIMG